MSRLRWRTFAMSVVTEPVIIEVEGRTTAEEAVVMGNEVLIGQTVLESLDLFVDCKRRRLVPNPAHPDEEELLVRVASAAVPAPSARTRLRRLRLRLRLLLLRLDRCPCHQPPRVAEAVAVLA